MNKKFLSVGLLTLGLISANSTLVNAAGPFGGGNYSYTGEATEVPSDTGIYVPMRTTSTTYNPYTAFVVGKDVDVNTAGVTKQDDLAVDGSKEQGLTITQAGTTIDFTSGDELTMDNAAYITIDVSNPTIEDEDTAGSPNMERDYNKVQVNYTDSRNNILDVESLTHSTNIPAHAAAADAKTVSYEFKVTLKDTDEARGYVDWVKLHESNGDEGHAPIVEDLEFTIKGYESNEFEHSKDGSFSAKFYFGNPTTNNEGAIGMSYDQDDIVTSPAAGSEELTADVCYNGYAEHTFELTNTGSEFIEVNADAFEGVSTNLQGEMTENDGKLTFLFNGVDLYPFWNGDEEMYPLMDYDQWQTFTVNPGETAEITIIAEGESLEDYEDQELSASVTIPFSDWNENYTDDYTFTMNYYYDENNPTCGDEIATENNNIYVQTVNRYVNREQLYTGKDIRDENSSNENNERNVQDDIAFSTPDSRGLSIVLNSMGYSSGNALTADNSFNVSFDVTNKTREGKTMDSMSEKNYSNVQVVYTGSRYNLLDVESTTYYPVEIPASNNPSENPETVTFDFEFTLKDTDEAKAYLDLLSNEKNIEADNSKIAEDLQFTIKGYESNEYDHSKDGTFSADFYLGDPSTSNQGAIAITYN